ncbi:hypothetical protein D3C80_2220870 [compost metagenome]
MAVLGLLPGNDFTRVLNEDFALGNILHGKDALAMDARAPGLYAALGRRGRSRRQGAGHWNL